jgi:Family of unknown function (DUF5309)
MAGTVVATQNVSTAEFLEDEKDIDMDERIKVLVPDETQFVTMTSRLGSTAAVREKVNWLEEEDFPRLVSSVGAVTNVATTLVLTTGQGKLVRENDILRNMRTKEAVRLGTITGDSCVIARAIGSVPGSGQAMNAGDVLLVVADAQPQGSDFPVARYLQRVLGYNYTQITRTPWTFTGTATSIELFGGREPAKEAKRKAREHKKKWESLAFFGARSYAAAVGVELEPQHTTGGLVEYITTFRDDVNGPLTADFFDAWLMDSMQYGSTDKVLFAAPIVVASMSKWNRTGMGSQFEAPDGGKVHGVQIDAFISGAYGYRIPVVVKKEWQEFYDPTNNPKGFGSYAFLVDMSLVSRRPMRDRDTKLLTDQQPKGKDTYAAEYMTEAAFQIAHERAHGILYGVTPT